MTSMGHALNAGAAAARGPAAVAPPAHARYGSGGSADLDLFPRREQDVFSGTRDGGGQSAGERELQQELERQRLGQQEQEQQLYQEVQQREEVGRAREALCFVSLSAHAQVIGDLREQLLRSQKDVHALAAEVAALTSRLQAKAAANG